MNLRAAIAVLAMLGTLAVVASDSVKTAGPGQVIYDASKAVEAGKELITQLRSASPASSFTNTGTLRVKAKRQPLVKLAYECRVIVTPTNWTSFYSVTQGTNALPGFTVEHRAGQPNVYRDDTGTILSGSRLDVALAGSDFWLSDLGLEFFQWPEQRVLRWEMKSHVGCKVLESRNPNPSATGYARVLSWIHDESLGIVLAEAYDAQGKLIKEFRPRDFEKVNGEWRLRELEMETVKTGSFSTLTFDLQTP